MSQINRATQANASQPLTYTNSFADVGTAAVTATQIFSAASNVNGAYVEYVGFSGCMSGGGGANVTILAKATAPANNVDGDVIFKANTGAGNAGATAHQIGTTVQQTQRIKIAAGKGLYLNQTLINALAPVACEKTVLYTLL